jgi:hypothetical protein
MHSSWLPRGRVSQGQWCRKIPQRHTCAKRMLCIMLSHMNDAPNGDSKKIPAEDYRTHVILRKDKTKLKEYEKYVKEHNRRLRRLEREAAGEFVSDAEW